ncbi:MAG: hypothetical protein ACLTW9_04225 [Enterocloster sp.]
MDSGLPLTGPEGIRRKLGAIDMEFFGRAYFPHYFSKPSPGFHRDLDAIWQEGVLKGRFPSHRLQPREIDRLPGCRRAVAAPREAMKSTTLDLQGQHARHPVSVQALSYHPLWTVRTRPKDSWRTSVWSLRKTA